MVRKEQVASKEGMTVVAGMTAEAAETVADVVVMIVEVAADKVVLEIVAAAGEEDRKKRIMQYGGCMTASPLKIIIEL